MGSHISLTIPQDAEMIVLQLAGQGGDAEEQLNLPSSSLQKQRCRKSFLPKEGLCQSDVRGEGIRSSGNGCRISLEHEGGFQLIWKSGS